MRSRESIAEAMEVLKGAHFNAAFVNVWSRGYPLWQSEVFAQETGESVDPEFAGRDVLREAMEEGAARGITVVPWIEYGLIGWWAGRGPGETMGPLLDRRPEWLARRSDGGTIFTEARHSFGSRIPIRTLRRFCSNSGLNSSRSIQCAPFNWIVSATPKWIAVTTKPPAGCMRGA